MAVSAVMRSKRLTSAKMKAMRTFRPARIAARSIARVGGPVLLAMLAFGVPGASALVARVGTATLSYQPIHRAAPPGRVQTGGRAGEGKGDSKKLLPLEYHGGPVMSSNSNYTLYWDPAGAPAYPVGYQAGLNRYFEDLAADSGGVQNTDSVLAQYKDGAGEYANYDSHFAGELLDTDPYPANGCSAAPICLTDAQLRAEITRYVAEHGLPADLSHE